MAPDLDQCRNDFGREGKKGSRALFLDQGDFCLRVGFVLGRSRLGQQRDSRERWGLAALCNQASFGYGSGISTLDSGTLSMGIYFLLALSLTLLHFRVSLPSTVRPLPIFAVLCGTPFSYRCFLGSFLNTKGGRQQHGPAHVRAVLLPLVGVSLRRSQAGLHELRRDPHPRPAGAAQECPRVSVFLVVRKPTWPSRCGGWVSICA